MEKKENIKNKIVAGMRPVEIVGLMLGILLAMDVTSHLPVAYSNMLRALEESTAAEDLLHQLGSQARYIYFSLLLSGRRETNIFGHWV